MKFRTLGMSGLRVSAVGLGCMGLSHAYGTPVKKNEFMSLLANIACSLLLRTTMKRHGSQFVAMR